MLSWEDVYLGLPKAIFVTTWGKPDGNKAKMGGKSLRDEQNPGPRHAWNLRSDFFGCTWKKICGKLYLRDFPGGPGIKNLTPNAGDVGLIPSQGTKIPYTMDQLSCEP